MNYESVIQFTDECKTAIEAIQVLAFLRGQDGLIGGRILAPGKNAHFTVQVFFRDDAPDSHGSIRHYGDWLPTGCRRVLLPNTLRLRIA